HRRSACQPWAGGGPSLGRDQRPHAAGRQRAGGALMRATSSIVLVTLLATGPLARAKSTLHDEAATTPAPAAESATPATSTPAAPGTPGAAAPTPTPA